MTQEYIPPTGAQYHQYPPQYYYPPRPPQKSAATTVILTLLLGVFGAIAAAGQSNTAKQWGYETGRYWVAFGVTMIFNVMWVIDHGACCCHLGPDHLLRVLAHDGTDAPVTVQDDTGSIYWKMNP